MEPSESAAPAPAAPNEQVTEKPKQSADTGEPKASGIKPRSADREREKEERKETAAKELKARRTASELAEELAEKRERRESGDSDDKPATSKDRDDKGKFAGKKDEPATERKAPEAKPEPAKREPAADAELQASKAVQDARRARAEAETHRRTAEQTTGELAKERKRIEGWKANPLDFLEDHGYSLERVINEINDGKLKPRASRPQLPPEYAEEFEALKADRQARIEEQRKGQEAKVRRDSEQVIGSYLNSPVGLERFPFLASTDWATSDIVRRALEAKANDAEPFMIELEADLEKNALKWTGNERSFRAMLKRNPGLRTQLMSFLDASPSNEASPAASNGAGKGSADGPRSLSSVPSGNTVPSSYKPTKEERKRQAAADLAARRREEAREDD